MPKKLPEPTYVRINQLGQREEIYTCKNGWGLSLCRTVLLPPMDLDNWNAGIMIKLSSTNTIRDWYLTASNPLGEDVISPLRLAEVGDLLSQVRKWEQPSQDLIQQEVQHYFTQKPFQDLKIPDPPKNLPPGQYIVDAEGNYHPITHKNMSNVPGTPTFAEMKAAWDKAKTVISSHWKEPISPKESYATNDPLDVVKAFIQNFFCLEPALPNIEGPKFDSLIALLHKLEKSMEETRDQHVKHTNIRRKEFIHSIHTQRMETFQTLIALLDKMYNLHLTYKDIQGEPMVHPESLTNSMPWGKP